jgi:hypothetical protein
MLERPMPVVRARKRGRPTGSKGLHYLEMDTRLLCLAETLRLEWRWRNQRPPSQFAAIRKVVRLCRRPGMARLLGLPNVRLGADEHAIVTRLRGRKRVLSSIAASIQDLEQGERRYYPPAELFEELHRKWPDLQLLPDEAKDQNQQRDTN